MTNAMGPLARQERRQKVELDGVPVSTRSLTHNGHENKKNHHWPQKMFIQIELFIINTEIASTLFIAEIYVHDTENLQ